MSSFSPVDCNALSLCTWWCSAAAFVTPVEAAAFARPVVAPLESFHERAPSHHCPGRQVWRYYLLAVRPETSDSGGPCSTLQCQTLRLHVSARAQQVSQVLPAGTSNCLPFCTDSPCLAAFQWDDFAAKNNAELNDNLGNFINRTLKFIYARWVCRVVWDARSLPVCRGSRCPALTPSPARLRRLPTSFCRRRALAASTSACPALPPAARAWRLSRGWEKRCLRSWSSTSRVRELYIVPGRPCTPECLDVHCVFALHACVSACSPVHKAAARICHVHARGHARSLVLVHRVRLFGTSP